MRRHTFLVASACRIVRSTIVLSVLFGISAAGVRADDLYWDNMGGGLSAYNNANFWSLDAALTMPAGAAPGASDNAFFGVDATYSVILGAPSAATNVTFSNGIVEFLDVGGSILNSGGLVTIDDPFAAGLGDGARVTLNSATWTSVGDVTIGSTGFGSLTLNNGGDLTGNRIFVGNSAGAEGEVTLTGDGTTLTASLVMNEAVYYIGNDGGTGTLHVLAGADLLTTSTIGNDIVVGRGVGSVGTLNVDGAGSFAETEDLVVGSSGSGFLNITGGGVVQNTDGGINGNPDTTFAFGGGSSGTGVVDGDGSLLRSRLIDVGFDGVGRLEVRAGGVARTLQQGTSAGDMRIGFNAGSDGKVAVYGMGTAASLLDVDNTLYVGEDGLGVLLVGQDIDGNAMGSGALQVDDDLRIGDNSTNTLDNRVVIDGANATANVGGDVFVGNAGHGALEISGGGVVTVAGGFSAGDLPDSDGTVSVAGLGSQLTVNDCCFFVGREGTGLLTISSGAFVQANTQSQISKRDAGDGTVTVTGADNGTPSTIEFNDRLDLGDPDDPGGTGTLNIFDGGRATVADTLFFAGGQGGTATIELTGAGSSLETNGDFLFGHRGVGTMNVNAGTSVTSADVDMGSNDPGTGIANIDGAGAMWSISGQLLVGEFGVGTVNITGGGLVEASTGGNFNLQIGSSDSADGSSVLVDGVGSHLDHQGTGRLSVGGSGGSVAEPSKLTVTGGGQVSTDDFFVADSGTSNAEVMVSGPGSRIDADGEVVIGDQGVGEATIEAGGVIESQANVRIGGIQSGTGTANVSGAGSQLVAATTLSVAAVDSGAGFATGTMNITDGGLVTNAGYGFIAQQGENVGTVNVGGAGDTATWNNGSSLFVGGSDTAAGGTGTLNVYAGGTVDVTSTLSLWYNGTVNLEGGTIETSELLLADPISAPFPAFNWTSGTFRFKGNQNLDMETLDDLLGTVHTLVAGQELQIANTATLSVPLRLNGGTFSVGAITPANLANLDFDAGTFNLTSANLTVGAGGLFGATLVIDPDQTINVTNQTTVNAGAELVAAGGFSSGGLTNDGDLVAIDTTIGGPMVNNNNVTVVGTVDFDGLVSGPGNFYGPGTANFNVGLSPGASPAEVSFEGNVALAETNTLFIEIAGPNLGDDYDSLTIGGSADLDGLLSVSLEDFTPSIGQQFTVLSAGSITDHGLLLGGPAASSFSMMIGGTSVILEALAPFLAGDYNGDGTVNAADYTVYRNRLAGIGGTTLINEGVTPGVVTIEDYTFWKTHYGDTLNEGTSLAHSTANVPEPASLWLVFLAAVGWLVHRRPILPRSALHQASGSDRAFEPFSR